MSKELSDRMLSLANDIESKLTKVGYTGHRSKKRSKRSQPTTEATLNQLLAKLTGLTQDIVNR